MDKTGRHGISGQATEDAAASRSSADLVGMHDLKPFADQLMAIAQQLRAGEFDTAPARPLASPDGAQSSAANAPEADRSEMQREAYARLARHAYSIRRQREEIFGHADLFGEPAWDILLDLYVAFVDDKPVSVSSACIGSASPPTTGLRWLGVLADNDLIVREADPEDQRRVLVRLTGRSIEAMDRYFASVSGSS